MLAATYPLMPRVARLHAAGDLTGLNRLVVRTARGVLFFAVPTGLVLIVFAPQILGLFGQDFGGGSSAIRILAIGEVANVLTGYGGLVLVMTGYEKDLTRCAGLGAALNLCLSAALIPQFDVPGAAVATATGVTLSNILMMWLAWRRLRIWTGVVPLGRLRPRT
jgi:O-antigen/teichoic acid export membrane protein